MQSLAPVCTAAPSATRTTLQAQRAHNKVLAVKRVATSLGAAAVVLSASALPVLAADLQLGAEVFSNNCAACHNGGLNSVQIEKTLKKPALEQYLAGGFNVDAIVTQVTYGKGGMPAWGDRLDEDEIIAVANYVFDQASGDKW